MYCIVLYLWLICRINKNVLRLWLVPGYSMAKSVFKCFGVVFIFGVYDDVVKCLLSINRFTHRGIEQKVFALVQLWRMKVSCNLVPTLDRALNPWSPLPLLLILSPKRIKNQVCLQLRDTMDDLLAKTLVVMVWGIFDSACSIKFGKLVHHRSKVTRAFNSNLRFVTFSLSLSCSDST